MRRYNRPVDDIRGGLSTIRTLLKGTQQKSLRVALETDRAGPWGWKNFIPTSQFSLMSSIKTIHHKCS